MAKLTDLTGSSITEGGEEIRIKELTTFEYIAIRDVSDPSRDTFDTTSDDYDPYFTHTVYLTEA